MKKLVFIVGILAIGLWSCSSDDDNNGITPPDGNEYVNVTIGNTSIDPENSDGKKSIVSPGGTTSWNTTDNVMIIDVDGSAQEFTYGASSPMSSANFEGKLKAGRGKQTYRAYHIPQKSKVVLGAGNVLTVNRTDIEINEDGVNFNSALFGSYCPMVAIPVQFDANVADDRKLFTFYHITNMIEGRVALHIDKSKDAVLKVVDKVTFEVKATDGTKPFYNEIQFDMNVLKTNSKAEDLDDCITPTSPVVATDHMITTMNLAASNSLGGPRTVKDLMEEYKAGYFPIPIFALPTPKSFAYTATVSFYLNGVLQLQLEGSQIAARLNPAGLNDLNFDDKKIKYIAP